MQMEKVVFGGGCFWCTEAVFAMLKGVQSVTSGYAGGHTENPTYEQVSTGQTGHAEVIQIEYDPDEIAFPELLQVFFGSHDATQLNAQGADVGTQYRSAIYYTTERQGQMAQHYVDALNGAIPGLESLAGAKRIVTEVLPLEKFYPAEDFHKDYFAQNPQAGYCQLVIAPKVEKVGQKFKSLLK
jgi:peptide-methionine (S)-S-oxide reductase